MLVTEKKLRARGVCKKPIPVAVRSKAWVCDDLIAGIAGSDPAEGIYLRSCVFCLLCRELLLRRADHTVQRSPIGSACFYLCVI